MAELYCRDSGPARLMRIVHVSVGSLPPVFSRFGGAIQRRVGELAREQARRGHDVAVISPGAADATEEVDGVRVTYVRLRLPRPWSHLEFQTRAVASVGARRSRPDVVHFHSEPEGAVVASPLRARCVLTYDNFFFRGRAGARLAPLYREGLARFDALLPCSEHCRTASAAYWRLSPERMHVVHNGVDLGTFRPDPAARATERQRLDVTGPMVLYVGRVCRQKGTDTLLEAHGIVRERRPEARLVIAGPVEQFSGDAGTAQHWRERMQAAGAIYLGAVPDERLPALYNAADVFVMPTAELEMFGMAAVEAQACGTVVVASDHGGLRETVPLDSGRRFTPRDARGLAAAVIGVLEDEAGRERRSAGARRHVGQYAWPRVVDELEDVYRSRISGSHGG